MAKKPGDDKNIDPVFRNGAITVVGIVLSFSLGFMTQWAANPQPWDLIDLPTVVFLAAGVVLQFFALAWLLDVRSIQIVVYNRAKNVFLVGLGCIAFGVLLAIGLEFFRVVEALE